MVDPLSLVTMAGVKTGIDLAMDATPKIFNEIHDAQTKRHLTKLNLIFLEAKMGKADRE